MDYRSTDHESHFWLTATLGAWLLLANEIHSLHEGGLSRNRPIDQEEGAPTVARLPASLLDGFAEAASSALGIASLRHRSAVQSLGRSDAIRPGAVTATYQTIAANWRACRAAGVGSASSQNWRWRDPQLQIGALNTSPEVVLERAIVGTCERLGRTDWSNQVPVASGVAGPSAERRRAIDLVRQSGPSAFEFIELKIASDNPLYAALEIVGYTVIWLLSREEAKPSALLRADAVTAVVLAPHAYYARCRLDRLEAQLDQELVALGEAHGVSLRFRFEAFPDHFARGPYTDADIAAWLSSRKPLHR